MIRPVLALLDPSCVVFIVPDKVLNYVPFAALLCPETERYFVEDFVFELAPSSSLMISCSQRANERSGPRNERILSVGNPTFDRAKYPLLQDLPSAAREADLVARLYSSSKILIGPEADAQQLKAAMLDADVIHFAGHYIANERSPLTSRLLLSKNLARSGGNGDEDGDLSASEVYRMPLRRARLVVLSACGTGIERYYRGEGALGIARPFIKAGAPVVIASLWPVDSEPTARLMIDFHSRRKLNGLNVVEALRAAQLSMLNSSESSRQDPHTWAAFVPIGGLVKF